MSQQNVKTATHESKDTSGVKPKATKKAPRKAAGSIVSEELMTALEATPIEMVAYAQLRDTELNCRIVPHTEQEITDLAETIKGIGILQNLVVVEEPDGTLGVVAGSGRKRATGLLVEQGVVKADQRFIPVKKISREMAVVASMTENGQRKQMHPAEQIVGFRTLSGEGKTDAQIGDLLGYGSRHVQRMLKLAGLAPSILDALAKDELTTEHCHALALESDQDRQLQVLEAARQNGYNNKPQINEIRTLITASEVSTSSNKFVFVGRDAFSDAEIRRDLFSDADEGYVDRLLLDTRVMDKLKQVAEELKTREGWSWCLARMEGIAHHGEDAKNWRLSYEPDLKYTQEEEQRRDALSDCLDALPDDSEEASVIEAEYTMIDEAAQARVWTDEQRAAGGVVVSFNRELIVQRGVVVKVQGSEQESSNAVTGTHSLREPDPADDISIPLLTKMSSERTLAVRGALAQQPARAFAVLVWTLCQKVFHTGYVQESPMRINLECSDYSLCNDAPSGETGMAYIGIQEEKKRLELLLPAGWKQEVSTFFSLSEDVLMALAGFCGAMSINGVQTRDCGHTSRSPLNRLEKAIGFHMRDWWQPTKANYFDHIGKTQIIDVLKECNLTGAASDAEKMKKGDAAEHAEHLLAQSRWVPAWMTSKDAQGSAVEEEEEENEEQAAETAVTHTDAA